jgi:myo-inositol-hexaphosphate 3-phosphohydrolase
MFYEIRRECTRTFDLVGKKNRQETYGKMANVDLFTVFDWNTEKDLC